METIRKNLALRPAAEELRISYWQAGALVLRTFGGLIALAVGIIASIAPALRTPFRGVDVSLGEEQAMAAQRNKAVIYWDSRGERNGPHLVDHTPGLCCFVAGR